MQITSLMTDTFTFLKAATSATTGNDLSIAGAKVLTVEIFGTAESKTVEFEQQGPSGAWYPINGVNTTLATPVAAIETSGTSGEIWTFDISGVFAIRMNLTAVTGGNVSAVGRVNVL